jgi:hypothetical protein
MPPLNASTAELDVWYEKYMAAQRAAQIKRNTAQ